MPRLTQLEDLLFPVDVYPVFVSVIENGKERRLVAPDKKAIVNKTNHHVLGIVSRGYRLVSNKEALDMAHECCRMVFPETKSTEWEAKATDAPSTAGYCHIDLIDNSTALDFTFVSPDQRPDAFGPFIRVTNSYNRLRALQFDIGFYRKICKNGLIVPNTIIRFRFTHQRRDIGESIQFEVAQEKVAKLKNVFIDSLARLRKCPVLRSQFQPLIDNVLLLRPSELIEPDTREADDWHRLREQMGEMINRYSEELGENAYAVFNAIAELASHPPENRALRRDRHSLQRLAGSWFSTFSSQCCQPDFTIEKYLSDLLLSSA